MVSRVLYGLLCRVSRRACVGFSMHIGFYESEGGFFGGALHKVELRI